MIVAKIYPEPQKYKRGGAKSSVTEQLSSGKLSQARLVLKVLPVCAYNHGILRA
jgi:hypothetical protein